MNMTVDQLLKLETEYASKHTINTVFISSGHPDCWSLEGLFCQKHISIQNRNLTDKLKQDLSKWKLTSFEMLMILCYMGNLSEVFDDGDPETSPYPINEMCKALDKALMKAPNASNIPVLYRQCRRRDVVDGTKEGDTIVFPHYLTTSLDNWNQDNHQFIITPNKNRTKARALYMIRDKTGEKQVTFMRNSAFMVTKIESFVREGCHYKRIFMKEL